MLQEIFAVAGLITAGQQKFFKLGIGNYPGHDGKILHDLLVDVADSLGALLMEQDQVVVVCSIHFGKTAPFVPDVLADESLIFAHNTQQIGLKGRIGRLQATKFLFHGLAVFPHRISTVWPAARSGD